MNGTSSIQRRIAPKTVTGLADKNLALIPFRFAIEMQNRGWIVRNVVIWHKPNCMPSSVKDRFTVDFDYIFFFTKSHKYWFERQREGNSISRVFNVRVRDVKLGRIKHTDRKASKTEISKYREGYRIIRGRNKRCVWTVPVRPFKGAHFATYPEGLIETPIRAGCPPGGIVLDPFFGAGTTGVACLKLNRNFIGIELNPQYVTIAERRLATLLTSRKVVQAAFGIEERKRILKAA